MVIPTPTSHWERGRLPAFAEFDATSGRDARAPSEIGTIESSGDYASYFGSGTV